VLRVISNHSNKEFPMKTVFLTLALTVLSGGVAAQDTSEEVASPFAALDWHRGPATENVGTVATLKTSAGLSFLDEENSRTFLGMTGNIPEDGNYIIVPEDANWWAAFTFDAMGYVKDDEEINADELLASLKSSDEGANDERRRLGLSELYTVGWSVPPHYDSQTKQLEWGVKVQSEGTVSVNYTVRLLGRRGVMNAILVADEETLKEDVATFKTALAGFSFNNGERYSEFVKGDKVAEYGLAALVVGGAAAVAAKSGLLAKFWKLIVFGAVGLFAMIGKLLGRKKDAN
jgi:uncharacterized membrane-anchored protein